MRAARAELEKLREDALRGWRELLFNSSFQDRLPEIGVLAAGEAERLGATGPAARAAGLVHDVRATSPRLAYDAFEPAVPERAAGDVQARLEQRALELRQSFELLDALLDRPLHAVAAAHEGEEREIGIGRVESPRGATSCIVERSGSHDRATPAAHRLLRELAVGRAGGRRRPPARLPARQQELRALLRLRRPLMLTLLRDLRRLRLELALPGPKRGGSLALRHVDAGSCNGCEHELTLTSSPYYDLQRFGLGVVASPRHADVLLVTGAVTTRMHEPLLVAYRAMPEPRRVVALGDCALGCNLLGRREELVGPVEEILPVDLRIPGCPPTPAAIAEALLTLLDG